MAEIVISGEGSGGNFAVIPPPSQGIHNAVCVEIYDRGLQDTPWGKKRSGWIVFQIEELIEGTESDFDGHRKEVRVPFNIEAGFHPKSFLRKFLENWRGKPLTADEIRNFPLQEKLVNKCCRLFVNSYSDPDKNGRTYARISDESAMPPKKMIEPLNYTPIDERKKKDSHHASSATADPAAYQKNDIENDIPF